jgi:hypothetical protein
LPTIAVNQSVPILVNLAPCSTRAGMQIRSFQGLALRPGRRRLAAVEGSPQLGERLGWSHHGEMLVKGLVQEHRRTWDALNSDTVSGGEWQKHHWKPACNVFAKKRSCLSQYRPFSGQLMSPPASLQPMSLSGFLSFAGLEPFFRSIATRGFGTAELFSTGIKSMPNTAAS